MKRVLLIVVAISTASSTAYAGLSIDTTPVLPSSEIHPSLYFTIEDIPTLRERVDSPPYSDWWGEILAQSDSYLGRDLSSSGLTEEERSKGAKACAFAFIITGDVRYARKAEEALLAMWVSPGSNNRRMLDAAYHLQSFCEAYDWIQAELKATDESSIRQKLASEAERFYDDPVMWSPFGYANNWGVKAASALGTVALTISAYHSADHSPTQWLGRALVRINSLLTVLTTDDGLWIEGSHYLTYTCGNLIPFLWHYKNVSNVDLFDDLRPLFDFALQVRCPDGRLPNIEDAFSNIFPHSMVAPAFEEEDACHHMWAYEESPGFDKVWWTQDVKEADLIIIHDTSIPVSPPTQGPSFFLNDARVAALRSSWSEGAMYLYLNGAPDYTNLLAGGVHTHPDPLECILYAKKALLANDAGYGPDGFNDDNRSWYTSPEAHNIILVNGSAPSNASVTMRNSLSSGELSFVGMSALYGGATISRGALFVGDTYGVIVDHVSSEDDKRYDLLLHGRGQITQDDHHIKWSVTNDDSVFVDLTAYFFPRTTSIELHSGLASFEYGQEEVNHYIKATAQGNEVIFLTILFPKLTSDPFPEVRELSGETYTGAWFEDDLIVAQGDTTLLSLEGLETDATFTVARRSDPFPNLWLIQDGTTLHWGETALMRSTGRISLAASPPTLNQYALNIARNELHYDLYLTLPDSLWANSASIDETDIPFRLEADGVSLEINGGGSLTVGLGRALGGDVIPDGVVDVLDLVRAVNIILDIGPTRTRHEFWAADTNYDEKIDLLDLFNMVCIILSNH